MNARCRTANPDLFFHPDGERGRARAHRALLAKEICRICPVIDECLAQSVRHQEYFGTWGGLAEHERHQLLHRRTTNIRTHRTT